MTSHVPSRRAPERSIEKPADIGRVDECTDDSCFEADVSGSMDLVNALADDSIKLQGFLDALALARPQNSSGNSELYMKLRAECIELIADGFGGEGDAFAILDGELNADTMLEFTDAAQGYSLDFLDDDESAIVAKAEADLVEAWTGVFIHSLVTRYRMMEMAVQSPHAFRTMFSSEVLIKSSKQADATTNALKMVAAFDIGRGMDKSIILRVHADPSVREYDDQSLLGYYISRYPNATEEIRGDIRCMAMGVGATGGKICERIPAQNGLCRMDADNIDLGFFPALKAKIEFTLEKERKQVIAECIGWARSSIYPKVLDPTHDIASQQAGSSRAADTDLHHVSKRAARRQAAQEKVDQAAIAAQESEATFVRKITVRNLGGKPLEIDLTDSDLSALDTAVAQLMAGDIVSDYLRDYDNPDGLIQFMDKALRAILDPDEISSRSIERLPGVRSVDVDGQMEKAYRLSGVSLMGAGGGKLAKDTRVLFSVCNSSGHRSVTLRAVLHRGDSKYSGPKDLQKQYFY